MSKNTIPTRIQSRLSRKGIKITLGDIKDELIKSASNADDPTDDEINSVVQYFVDQASMPVIFDKEEIFLEDEEAIAIVDEPLIQEPEEERSLIIKSEAQALGIVLNDAEIIQIASNLNQSSDEFHNSLDEIKSAIISFVRHKAFLDREKVNELVGEVNNIVWEEFNNTSSQLTEGLQNINENMQTQSRDFKRKVTFAIAAFNIPSKAG